MTVSDQTTERPTVPSPSTGVIGGTQDATSPRRSVFFVLRRTVREFLDDGGTDLAAAMTYYSVLSLFPGMIVLLALVGVFGQAQRSVQLILEVMAPLVSADALDRLRTVLTALAGMPGAGLALVVGIAGALLSASGYVGAFRRAMNRVYEVEEGRTFLRLRGMQVLVTLATVVLSALALFILIVSGPVAVSLGHALGLGDDLVLVWGYAKWPVLAVVVMAVVALLYWATPNVAFRSFKVISVGAFVAILAWLVASVGFAVYVAYVGRLDATYGSVTGVVVALLWLWITNVALVFGGELDAELERGRQLQHGIRAERRLQLPLRGDRALDRAARRRDRDEEVQREIRLAAGGPGHPADRPFQRR